MIDILYLLLYDNSYEYYNSRKEQQIGESEFHATINFDGNNSENKFAEENLLSPNDQTGKVEESNKERNCRAGVWSREKNQKRGKTVEEPFAGKSRWNPLSFEDRSSFFEWNISPYLKFKINKLLVRSRILS